MGLFSNRLDRESLKPGDHIYSWRAAYLYAHHGIYVGDEKVIHFTRTGQKTGTSSVVDVLMVSSAPPPYLIPCPNCPPTNNTNGVIASCLDCFLAGGVLYRYEYSTNAAIFLAKPLDATCTLGASEPPETVVFRANYLLENGFGCYDIFKNNCQDFAIYCKTSLLISDKKSMTPQNAHAASTIWKSVTGLFSNRLDRESLKPGDHIYSWRAAYIYAHHGIYVSDEKVIHFTRTGQNTGTSSVVDVLMVSSMPKPSLIPCPNCPPTNNTSGVIASCLDCFLAGGVLSRYEYSTNAAILLAKPREATCTLAPSDPPGDVIYRANYLLDLEKGFGRYNVFKNNCQDFAIYCKTGLLVSDKKSMTPQNAHAASFIWKSVTGLLVSDKKSISQSGHVASIFGKTLTGVVSGMQIFANTNIYAKTAVSVGSGVVTHFVSRYSYDIGIRSDVIKVPVEEVVRTLHNKVN